MRDALESKDKALPRGIIQQFVAKIVLKAGRGTCSRAFPDDSYMPGFREVDLRGSVPLTRHIHAFDISIPRSTQSNLRNPDKAQLRTNILAKRADGMSYRQLAQEVGLRWTRVQQIVKSAE